MESHNVIMSVLYYHTLCQSTSTQLQMYTYHNIYIHANIDRMEVWKGRDDITILSHSTLQLISSCHTISSWLWHWEEFITTKFDHARNSCVISTFHPINACTNSMMLWLLYVWICACVDSKEVRYRGYMLDNVVQFCLIVIFSLYVGYILQGDRNESEDLKRSLKGQVDISGLMMM